MSSEQRKLTASEEKRHKKFEELSDRLISEGYKRVDLKINMLAANVFSVALFIVYAAATVWIFHKLHSEWSFDNRFLGIVVFLVCIIVLTIVHELIHGATWACFTERHWKDIEFGFIKSTLTPYCTCSAPLSKGKYVIGALMPMFILGILPTVAAFITGSVLLLLIGAIMFASAAGDIMIVWKFLTHKIEGKEAVYIDHPTEAGSVIFER